MYKRMFYFLVFLFRIIVWVLSILFSAYFELFRMVCCGCLYWSGLICTSCFGSFKAYVLLFKMLIIQMCVLEDDDCLKRVFFLVGVIEFKLYMSVFQRLEVSIRYFNISVLDRFIFFLSFLRVVLYGCFILKNGLLKNRFFMCFGRRRLF